jgi:hypothetical protein
VSPLLNRKRVLGVLASLCILTAAVFYLSTPRSGTPQLKKIIFETDMCADVDDVGALAMLHAMADEGEADILAVMFNETHKRGAAAIDAINTWYGRGDIPVGIYRKALKKPDRSRFLDSVRRFPHDLSWKTAPPALDVYRQVLRGQPDHSVTIVSVGFLNNLYDLLKAEPDLVARKVSELVVMGSLVNDNFNLIRHDLVDQSEYVIRHWPGRLVISQYGHETRTGAELEGTSAKNPVRDAYYRYFGGSFKSRSSWDQCAVLYGVRGLSTCFKEITRGRGKLSNKFTWKLKAGSRSCLEVKISNNELEDLIEKLMIQPPARR